MVGEESAMPYANADALVSTEWLAAHLDAPDLRIVDGTFTLPGVKPTGRELYDARHIPGAVFFDIDEIADEHNPLPHMLPSPEKFAARMRKLGLGDGHKIVVYDSAGLSSAGRPWWMLRVFGHRDVAILDGGLPKWEAEGRAVTEEVPLPRERHFTARLNTLLVRDKGQVLDNLTAGRERGTPVVASCGSGVTACALAFGLHLLGWPEAAVYDGSWSEWGLPGDTPVATGPR